MPDRILQGRRILIAEDEFLLADELRIDLEEAGATVLGPCAAVQDLLAFLDSTEPFDGAVLDVSLGGELVYPAADRLAKRGVPFVFTTGFDSSLIPERFEGVGRCEKPLMLRELVKSLGKALGEGAAKGVPPR